MGPKKVSASSSEKKKKMLSIETKLEITEIKRHTVKCYRKALWLKPSTIGIVLKKKDAIKVFKSSKGVTIFSSKKTPLNDEVERLVLWIKEKEIAGVTVTEKIICQKRAAFLLAS